ncbi:MAG: isocitrate lyase/phosphoenolpyruvate mutase family protein [Candidatus Binatia bacterium]
MTATDSRKRFRKVLDGPGCIYPASIFDPVSARIAESLGFEIGMLAGSIASATVLGAPDLVLLTLTEFTEQVHRITRSCSLSLMVDADHGYGNALNVMRSVEELEVAGASALTIEDTLLPHPFGQEKGEKLISVEELSGKLKAAVTARRDASLVIVGRTAGIRSEGISGALTRIKACEEAGVDAIFLVGVKTRQEVTAMHQATSLPLLLGTIPPSLSDRDFLSANGVRIALQGHIPFRVMVKALHEIYGHLREGRSPSEFEGKAASDDQVNSVLREADYTRWSRDYMGKLE